MPTRSRRQLTPPGGEAHIQASCQEAAGSPPHHSLPAQGAQATRCPGEATQRGAPLIQSQAFSN